MEHENEQGGDVMENVNRRKFVVRPSVALQTHREALRKMISGYNVAHPRVYGSVLTGKDTEESDLDLLVDATESTTLFTLAGLEHEAQELLGVPVSVLTPAFLSVKFRDRVLAGAEPL
jgi:predicted nucleotidyltransferase